MGENDSCWSLEPGDLVVYGGGLTFWRDAGLSPHCSSIPVGAAHLSGAQAVRQATEGAFG